MSFNISLSGINAASTELSVTGNNIANVNTTGFKASQTQFQDTLSQVLTNAGASQDGLGFAVAQRQALVKEARAERIGPAITIHQSNLTRSLKIS